MIQFDGWEDQTCRKKRGSYHSYLFVRGGRSLFTLPKIYHVHLPDNFPTNISFSTFLSNFKLSIFWLPLCPPKSIFLPSCFHPTLEGRFGFDISDLQALHRNGLRLAATSQGALPGLPEVSTKWYPKRRHIWSRIDTENSHSWKEVHFENPSFFSTPFFLFTWFPWKILRTESLHPEQLAPPDRPSSTICQGLWPLVSGGCTVPDFSMFNQRESSQ